jgi:PRTRC genetic system protein A
VIAALPPPPAPDLGRCFAGLLRHHVATLASPEPDDAPGITWIFAANGVWKRGQDAHRTVLLPVPGWPHLPPVPGLAPLLPAVRWRGFPRRLPGQLLAGMLAHARKAVAAIPGSAVVQPIEQQYHVTLEAGRLAVRVPPQAATAARVTYAPPDAPVLLDLHSHHAMAAFFSGTDNRDDDGLGVSAVIGRIFTRPEIRCRLCCYGHVCAVPALTIFDSLGPCADAYSGAPDAP